MKVTPNPFNPKSAEPMEWTNYQGVKQVGSYLLLKDLTRKEIEAFKTIGRFFRYTSDDLSFRLIFKEPEPENFDKGEYGSIGWRIALGTFSQGESGDSLYEETLSLEVESALDREERIKEIQ